LRQKYKVEKLQLQIAKKLQHLK